MPPPLHNTENIIYFDYNECSVIEIRNMYLNIKNALVIEPNLKFD